MGDKSPKSKNRNKSQKAAAKQTKQAAKKSNTGGRKAPVEAKDQGKSK